MKTDFLEELRNPSRAYRDVSLGDLCKQAADQIERLQAERDRLRVALEDSGKADIYRDGFKAAIDTVASFEQVTHHGPTDRAALAVKKSLLSILNTSLDGMQ